MAMYNSIVNFHHQFGFKPVINNKHFFRRTKKFIVTGMGGSQLAAELISTLDSKIDFIIHKDYGLPGLPDKELKQRLVIASSYSGNTEETLDSFETARKKKLPLIAISTGGKFLKLAKKYQFPYIQLPDTGIQPRSALGFSFMAILKALGQGKLLYEAHALSKNLFPLQYQKTGRNLAKKIKGFIPIIYASNRNYGLAYNWKIKLNETGKIPAFCNVIPELNHNEMNAFDIKKPTRTLCNKFSFIFLRDSTDHTRIRKRMEILERFYRERKLPVVRMYLKNKNPLHKIFSSVILADWTAYSIALEYGLDPEQVPMVEKFKKTLTAVMEREYN